jgi:uncharacterized membrane protein affecting hemolysin expression
VWVTAASAMLVVTTVNILKYIQGKNEVKNAASAELSTVLIVQITV